MFALAEVPATATAEPIDAHQIHRWQQEEQQTEAVSEAQASVPRICALAEREQQRPLEQQLQQLQSLVEPQTAAAVACQTVILPTTAHASRLTRCAALLLFSLSARD